MANSSHSPQKKKKEKLDLLENHSDPPYLEGLKGRGRVEESERKKDYRRPYYLSGKGQRRKGNDGSGLRSRCNSSLGVKKPIKKR